MAAKKISKKAAKKAATKPAKKVAASEPKKKDIEDPDLEEAVQEISDEIDGREYASSGVPRADSIKFYRAISQHCLGRAEQIRSEDNEEDDDENDSGGDADDDDDDDVGDSDDEDE